MINSRKIEDLHPIVAAKCRDFLARCKGFGIDVRGASDQRQGRRELA